MRHILKMMAVSVLLTATSLAPYDAFAKNRQGDKLISSRQVVKLVKKVRPGIKDAKGWGRDIVIAMRDLNIRRSRKNICAVMGIVKLESGFEADPYRKSFGPRAIKAIHKRLGKLPKIVQVKMEKWLHNHPTPDNNYYDRIARATTERELDLTYRDLVAAMLRGKLGALTKLKTVSGWIARLNAIDSIGSMQVAVALAVKAEEKRLERRLLLGEIWSLRDRLYKRRGSLYFGTMHLLGHDTGSPDVRYRFADYVAGRYASRNAAFQAVIVELQGKKLVLDGDLLRYRKSGKPTLRRGNTEKAVRKVAKKYGLDLGLFKIRADLKMEKQAELAHSDTYRFIQALYKKQTGKAAATVIMPQSKINSDKEIAYSTTRGYAQTANKTYQRCMKGRL